MCSNHIPPPLMPWIRGACPWTTEDRTPAVLGCNGCRAFSGSKLMNKSRVVSQPIDGHSRNGSVTLGKVKASQRRNSIAAFGAKGLLSMSRIYSPGYPTTITGISVFWSRRVNIRCSGRNLHPISSTVADGTSSSPTSALTSHWRAEKMEIHFSPGRGTVSILCPLGITCAAVARKYLGPILIGTALPAAEGLVRSTKRKVQLCAW